ncbi:hypothetical protein [Corynebacterium sp. CMW7794]|uniref:hypothetical protein n=1 Tax=Corynebacterium sp. CMW7794 TaxID=1603887 RepID=UPI000A5C70C6|nr:hypothetical protein [Corynebacterium sp. CMW7794]
MPVSADASTVEVGTTDVADGAEDSLSGSSVGTAASSPCPDAVCVTTTVERSALLFFPPPHTVHATNPTAASTIPANRTTPAISGQPDSLERAVADPVFFDETIVFLSVSEDYTGL